MDAGYSDRIQAQGGVRPLSTALRTLDLLEQFAASTRPLRLGEVAEAGGLSRATAYQRLLTLIEAGFLEQDDMGGYRLSMYPVRLAAAAMDQADLGARAEPMLQQLCARLGETVSLAILDRGRPCIIARAESNSLLRAVQEIGTVMDLAGSASGRVLVAFADEATLKRLRQGPYPLADAQILAETRAQGWALSSGYTGQGVRAIAAPVFDPRGVCRGAVSLVMPETRFDLARLIEPTIAAAREIGSLYLARPQGKDER